MAGYRDALAEIHAQADRPVLSPRLILDFHRRLYALTSEKGGRCLGKGRDAEWERIGSWSH